MSNSYGSIPADPDAGAESSGDKGACSKNKMYITLGVLVGVGVGILLASRSNNGSSPTMVARTAEAANWPEVLLKIDGATSSGFPNFVATTTTGAAAKGWSKSDEPCDPLLGEAWMYGGVRSKKYNGVVYFTPEVGDKPGVASGIEVDYYGYVEVKLIGKFFGEEKTSQDGTYRSLSVAIRDGKKENLCDKENSVPPGNAPYVRIAPGMANMDLPVVEDSNLVSNWREGSCLHMMGYHWSSDIEGGKDITYKAENLVPIVPMYSSKDKTLNGIFFVATSTKQITPFNPKADINMWDMSPSLTQVNKPIFYMCSNFCGECQFTGTDDGMFSSMHWMFKNTIFGKDADYCEGESQPFCRSDEYPTVKSDDEALGRCGPKFDGRKCNCSGWEKYCNTDNGWCGDTDAHKNAQPGTEYDCKDPGRCGPKFSGRKCNCEQFEEYCNTDNGWCGNTDAHKDAQDGAEYDCASSAN